MFQLLHLWDRVTWSFEADPAIAESDGFQSKKRRSIPRAEKFSRGESRRQQTVCVFVRFQNQNSYDRGLDKQSSGYKSRNHTVGVLT